jgi:hypothetical protein
MVISSSPGPWTYRFDRARRLWVIEYVAPEGGLICEVCTLNPEASEADVRFMAASPELFGGLRAALDQNIIGPAQQAIYKALGRA